MKEKYSTLINKSNKGSGTVKKSRKRRATRKGDSKASKKLASELQDRIDKRTTVPGTDRSVYEDERKHG
jgi:hypothetical protein